MQKLWYNDKFPSVDEMLEPRGIEHHLMHKAVPGQYHFLLGPAITKYNGVLRASWSNSWRSENDNNTILTESCSYDGGKSWQDEHTISIKEEGLSRSHGIYFKHESKLYAFCPVASYDKNLYPDLKMEAYLLNDAGSYDHLGIVQDDELWPMCDPITLDDGTLLMPGLKCYVSKEYTYGLPCVALCDGKDLKHWELSIIPDKNELCEWGETSVLKLDDKLIAVVRPNLQKRALISYSYDNGKSWTDLEESNFELGASKTYSGRLANGLNYVIFSAKGEGKYTRDTLAIAVGKDGLFYNVYIIRNGFEETPQFGFNKEWCYPYAYEDTDEGKLYVVYSKNKQDAELAIIPIESLKV